MAEPLMSLDSVAVLAEDLDHPEGVAWGADGYLYAGGEAGQVYRIDAQTGTFREIANTGGFVLGLCLDAEHNIYACDEHHAAVMRITPAGEVSRYADGLPVRRMQTPNYPVFDARGNLYVSDSGGWKEDNGTLYRISPEGEVEVSARQDLAFTNGMALHPDGSTLYVILSLLPGIATMPLGPRGELSDLEVVLDLPLTVPDGLAFDQAGQLYISCYTPDRIYRFAPETGVLDTLLEDWQHTVLCSPTNIAFAGPDRSHLVMASLGGRTLVQAPMAVPGCPLHYPRLP